MAKHLVRFAPRPAAPVIVVAPRRGGFRRAARRAGSLAHRGGRAAGRGIRRGGRAAAPVMGMALGGAIVGYAEGKGWLARLPKIGGSQALTVALAGYAATRFMKNPTIRMAGMAAIVAGAFDFGKVHAGGVSGFDGDGGSGFGGGV